jgi:hypothetical protein
MGLLGSLGSLNVLLSADTAQFSSAMDKAAFTAERDLQRISSKAKFNAAIITAAIVASATAVAVSVKKTIDNADKIGKMAQSLGMTTEQLSGLEYAAKMSGLQIEDLQSDFQKFNKAIFEATRGSKEQSTVFKALGISVTDSSGKIKSNYELLLDTADAFSKMNNSVQKSALAQTLFGKSGAAMIPLLNSGKDGIKQLADEAERLGVVIGGDTAQAAERFNDNMDRLAASTQGLITSFTSGFIPIMANFTEGMKSSSSALEGFHTAGQAAAAAIIVLASGLETIYAILKSVAIGIANFAAVIELIKEGNFKGAMEASKASAEDFETTWTDLAQTMQNNWDAITNKTQSSTENMKQNIDTTADSLKGLDKETNQLAKAGKDLGMTFQSAFEDAIIEGKSLSEVFASLLKDIERIILRYAITIPLANAISSLFPGATTASAHGNIFSGGRLLAFASGGLITRPTIFPMANGGMGLAGEAGTEAIMPLFRTGTGDLGVKSASRGVEINIYAPEGSSVRQDSQITGDKEQINIMIDEAVAGQVGNSGSKTYKALKKSFGLRQVLNTR